MADVLRATTSFPAFQAALSVHLLEVSPVMRALQRRTLSAAPSAQGEPPSVGSVHKEALGAEAEAPLVWTSPKQRAAGGVGVAWLSQLEDLPEDGTPPLLQPRPAPALAPATPTPAAAAAQARLCCCWRTSSSTRCPCTSSRASQQGRAAGESGWSSCPST